MVWWWKVEHRSFVCDEIIDEVAAAVSAGGEEDVHLRSLGCSWWFTEEGRSDVDVENVLGLAFYSWFRSFPKMDTTAEAITAVVEAGEDGGEVGGFG